MSIDVSEHNRRVRVASRAMCAAIRDDEHQAQHTLLELAEGDDQGALQWERLATGVYCWITMCTLQGRRLGIPDMRAVLPTTDGRPDPDMPPSVRTATHLFNLGLGADWDQVGEVLGAAIAADHGYETVTQVLWVCGNLLRRLRVRPAPHQH